MFVQYINYPWLRHGQSQKLCFLIKCLFELLKSTQNTQYEHLNEVVLFQTKHSKSNGFAKEIRKRKINILLGIS